MLINSDNNCIFAKKLAKMLTLGNLQARLHCSCLIAFCNQMTESL